ncbi:MAG: sodium/proton-translocating pyrophosphatase, partial [Dehalococcoidia bacterium]|nr:sodium/proton-translocating pyrophosphatase [Dehalococcoidia bacterium]
MDVAVASSLGAGLLALIFAAILIYRVMQVDQGNETMRRIAVAIQQGAMAFLRREYTYLAAFVVIVAIIVALLVEPRTAVAYVLGAVVSGATGVLGMLVATQANVRTAAAAIQGLNPALRVAFSSGTVMGMSVVGLGLLGVGLMYVVYSNIYSDIDAAEIMKWVAGFSFGASSIALFARVGGGIYTKAADVGADLVGKVEQGIPEDDPRNPATIADNVGDNVGDVAGMGADLFESYVGSIIAAMAVAATAYAIADYDASVMIVPMAIAGAGIARGVCVF